MAELRRYSFAKSMEMLSPGKEITVSGIKVVIEPLKFGALSKVIRKLNSLTSQIKDAGITMDNYSEVLYLSQLVSIVLESSPELLQEVTQIHIDDLSDLQFDELVKVVDAVLEVNAKSFEDLLKNWQSLTMRLDKIPFIQKAKMEGKKSLVKEQKTV